MTASAVFILDVKGKVIISRNYRGDVPMNCVERFSGHVLEAEEADERPVWLEHGTTYVIAQRGSLSPPAADSPAAGPARAGSRSCATPR